MRQLVFTVLMALLPAGLAKGPPDELVEIKAGETPQLRADRAYLLFRIPRRPGAASIEPLLMRVPTAAEMERFEQAKRAAFDRALPRLTEAYERELARRARREAHRRGTEDPAPQPPSIEAFPFVWDEVGNLQDVDFGDAFARSENENTYLVEAPPGEYVFYGMSPSTGLPRMVVCFCLGTVGFTAEKGRVTDLGYIIGDYARERSILPELAGETGFGPSSDPGDWILTTGTVRPVRSDSSLPAALRGASIAPAAYRAVGRFLTPNTIGINRLAPVPGVLEYRNGRVVDATTGAIVPDNL